MSWTWTAADRQAFQRLRLQLGRVLYEAQAGKPTKGAIEALARCHRGALKAVYPADAAADVALMRQWMRLVESYLDTDFDLERRLHMGALSTLQGDIALILGPAAEPDPPAMDETQAEPRAVRMPYRDD